MTEERRQYGRRKSDRHPKLVGLTRVLNSWKFWMVLWGFVIVLGIALTLVVYARQQSDRVATKSEVALNHRIIQQEFNALKKSDKQFCMAVQNVVAFWRLVRVSTIKALQDPTLSPAQKHSDVLYIQALNRIIRIGHRLHCATIGEPAR